MMNETTIAAPIAARLPLPPQPGVESAKSSGKKMTELDATDLQLEKLILEDSEFSELEQELASYCPFAAVGMVNAEIRHSNFLASMLDPYRPHGFGSSIMRSFLDKVFSEAGNRKDLSRIDLHLADIDDADIRREWNRIDILVVLPEIRLVVALELKIGATEHGDQLKRYADHIEHHWPSQGEKSWQHLLLMLSRGGDEPTDERWGTITYDVVISSVRSVLVKPGVGEPLARSMAAAYVSMLERNHVNNTKLEKIAESLWRRHKEALEYLMERRPDSATELSEEIKARMDALAQTASLPNMKLYPISATKTYMHFCIAEWDNIPGMNEGTGRSSTNKILLIEVENWQGQLRSRLVLGPGPTEIRERLFRTLQSGMSKGANRFTDQWKTIYSEVLCRPSKPDEKIEIEVTMKKFEEGFIKFIRGPISEFHNLLTAN
jgi:hypothetical protein